MKKKNKESTSKAKLILFYKVFVDAIKGYGTDSCSIMAGGISFFGLISFIPLLLISISIFGYIIEYSTNTYLNIVSYLHQTIPVTQSIISKNIKLEKTSADAKRKIITYIEERVPESDKIIQNNIKNTDIFTSKVQDIIKNKNILGIVGILGIIWSASKVFIAIENAVNVAWNVSKRRNFIKSKMFGLLMTASATLLFFTSIALTSLVTLIKGFDVSFLGLSSRNFSLLLNVATFIISTAVSIFLFFIIYKIVPTGYVTNESALFGAIVAGIMWEGTQFLYSWYITNVAQEQHLYGQIGAFLIMVVWVYYSAVILLFGAELGSAYERREIHLEVRKKEVNGI